MIRSKDLIYDFILRRDNIYLQTQYFWPILNSRNSNFRLFKEKFDHIQKSKTKKNGSVAEQTLSKAVTHTHTHVGTRKGKHSEFRFQTKKICRKIEF